MIKYFAIFCLIVTSLICPHSTYAQEYITLVESSTEAHFPGALVFKIKTESSSDIVKIRLNYEVEKVNFARVISEAWPEFIPAKKIDTRWTWDMRNSSLPPSATINYWWTIENSAGEKITTPSKTIKFNDSRYSWKSVASDKLTLFYYESNESVAKELVVASQHALEKQAADTGATLEKPVEIHIYADSQDLQGSMIFPREWTGGVAFTQYNTIAIGISSQNLNWGKKALAHELGHMVLHQLTFSPYGASLPTWLDEGFAMHAEGEIDTGLQLYLKKAMLQNALISIRSLSSPFSAKSDEAYLSYAESHSIFEFMIQNYGKEKLLNFFTLFKEGYSTDEALNTIYGFDQDGLEQRWKESLTRIATPGLEQPRNTAEDGVYPLLPALISAVAVFVLALGIGGWSYRKYKRKHPILK